MKKFNIYQSLEWMKEKAEKEIADCKLTGKRLENFKQRRLEKVENERKKIEELEKANFDVSSISILVSWHRSSTWGMNPYAEVNIYGKSQGDVNDSRYENYSGSASGCGYDKQSAAIAEALNQSDVLRSFLMNHIEILQQDGNYGIHSNLHFEGGVGTDCFVRIFKNLGFKVSENHSKTADSYSIYK